jgi:hypothetical protein
MALAGLDWDADFLRDSIHIMTQMLITPEVEEQIRAEKHESTPKGNNHRHGFRYRQCESQQMGSRVECHDLAQRMVLFEEESTKPIKVYTLTVFSRGLRTGDWAISTSLEYHLDALKDDRFQMVYAWDIYTLLARTNEDHFWVAYFELKEYPQAFPRAVLSKNGYRVGDEIVFQGYEDRIVLFPVWTK